MEGRHPTSSHREKSSDVSLRSSSGEEGCLGNWAGSVSSWNLCGRGGRRNHKHNQEELPNAHYWQVKATPRPMRRNPTSAFLFLLIILSSVCFISRIREWFRCSSQRFLRRTSQESRRTTAAGNTQHCREKSSTDKQENRVSAKHMWPITTTTKPVAPLHARSMIHSPANLFFFFFLPSATFTRPGTVAHVRNSPDQCHRACFSCSGALHGSLLETLSAARGEGGKNKKRKRIQMGLKRISYYRAWQEKHGTGDSS